MFLILNQSNSSGWIDYRSLHIENADKGETLQNRGALELQQSKFKAAMIDSPRNAFVDASNISLVADIFPLKVQI